MIALILVGCMDMVSVVVRSTLVQMATPDEMRGRVNAVDMIFIGASNEIGQFESGLTAQWFGAVPAVVLGGIGTLMVTALWAWSFPELRRVEKLSSMETSAGFASGHSRLQPVEARRWRASPCDCRIVTVKLRRLKPVHYLFLFQFFSKRGNDFEQIADDAVVGNFENRRVLVLVDRDDRARAFHSHDVLDGSADSQREIQFRRDRLAGAADLAVHGQPAFIADRTRSRQFAAEQFGQFFRQRNIFRRLDAASDGHQDRRLRKVHGLLGFAEQVPAAWCESVPA